MSVILNHVYDRRNADAKYMKTAADCENAAVYYFSCYGVQINEKAADVNADGVLNTTDVVRIRRYVAGGYDIVLKPAS